MKCNIDAKGKAVRLVIGLFSAAIGIVLLVLVGDDPLLAGIGIGACVGGAFAIFEGWSGWCAIRAMGFRTPL